MFELPILSITILLPLLSALYISLFIGHNSSHSKKLYIIYVAILSSALTLICSLYILFVFSENEYGYQFVEHYYWINQIGLDFYVGVDGISVYFVFLTSLLIFLCIIASLFTIKERIKEYLLCFLLLEALCIGAFVSLNLLLFYIFFEAILIPMYLIIGVWGGQNRIYAAIKFFLYTLFGSLLFLIALIYIYISCSSFNIPVLAEALPGFNKNIQILLWLGIFIAFAVKIPMIPFHTWLPDAHVEAPTTGSMILAGILLKLGSYGFLRVLVPLLPTASLSMQNYVIILSIITIIYGSLNALAQTDMKKMIAYSSIAHMGYVTAGIFTLSLHGLSGALFQMISHSVISPALFLIVGIIYERGHTKIITEYGGVAKVMPVLAIFFMISMLGSIGLPGSSGFVGEFFTILALVKYNIIYGLIASTGGYIGAIYMLKLYKEVMFGSVKELNLRFKDLNKYEIFSLLPLVVLIIYFGLMPNRILNAAEKSLLNLIQIYS